MRIEKITKYSWFDDGKSVKVMIEFDHEINEEMIQLDFDTLSLKLDILVGEDHIKQMHLL